MSDLSSQITSILNNPDMMRQISEIGGMLTQQNTPPPQPHETPPLLPNQTQSSDLLGADGLQAVMKIMPILNRLRQDDDTTKLLRAIKPFLSEERQKKLEEAIKIIRIINILPLMKNQGLSGLF